MVGAPGFEPRSSGERRVTASCNRPLCHTPIDSGPLHAGPMSTPTEHTALWMQRNALTDLGWTQRSLGAHLLLADSWHGRRESNPRQRFWRPPLCQLSYSRIEASVQRPDSNRQRRDRSSSSHPSVIAMSSERGSCCLCPCVWATPQRRLPIPPLLHRKVGGDGPIRLDGPGWCSLCSSHPSDISRRPAQIPQRTPAHLHTSDPEGSRPESVPDSRSGDRLCNRLLRPPWPFCWSG